MILTIALNPAIDKTCKTRTLIPGQINRNYEVREFPGGKGINVTRIIRLLDIPVTTVGFLGGYKGEYIRKAVSDSGATDVFTYIEGDTRVNSLIIADDGYVTEIFDPGPIIPETKQREFMLSYEALLPDSDVVVICGSLPTGVRDDFYVDVINKAKELGKKVILDTSSYALKEGVKAIPYMIKPNIQEMEYLTGVKLDNPAKIIEQARKLCDKGIEIVVVSMDKRGFIHVDKDKAIWATTPQMDVVNTVGCGDAMVAAYAIGLRDNLKRSEIIKRAAGMAAANTLTAESGRFDIDKAMEITEKVELKEWD